MRRLVNYSKPGARMDTFGVLSVWNYDKRPIQFSPRVNKPIYRYTSERAPARNKSPTFAAFENMADESVSRILRAELQTNKLFGINGHRMSMMSTLAVSAGFASHRRHNFAVRVD